MGMIPGYDCDGIITCDYRRMNKKVLIRMLRISVVIISWSRSLARPSSGHLHGEERWDEFPLPMQLAEARMSTEFINLHLLLAGGEGRR